MSITHLQQLEAESIYIIREVAAANGAQLIDAEQHFSNASSDGIPGQKWLWEHVHFNFNGNYQLAKLFADSVVEALAIQEGENDWPDMRTAMLELGLTLLHR